SDSHAPPFRAWPRGLEARSSNAYLALSSLLQTSRHEEGRPKAALFYRQGDVDLVVVVVPAEVHHPEALRVRRCVQQALAGTRAHARRGAVRRLDLEVNDLVTRQDPRDVRAGPVIDVDDDTVASS